MLRSVIRSSFASAVVGGLVVAGAFVAFGVPGHQTTRTVIDQAPIAAQPISSHSSGLTPHDIYTQDSGGVVFVRAQVVQSVQDPFNLFPDQQRSESTGSGFLIDKEGRILTNYHVIGGAQTVTVQFEGRVARTAKVVGSDPNNDLAVLKVDMTGVPENAKPLELGDSTSVQVGDPTLAIGNPFGLDRTLTSGIVSALQRQIQAPNGFAIDNVIQTDAPINPGNSGGPLLDALGRVIGINSQIATGGNGQGSVGIGFAVPINTAKEFLPKLESGAAVQHAYLGITGSTSAARHVVIQRAVPSGPAAKAGLKSGDAIQAIDGRAVSSIQEVTAVVNAKRPGDAITVTFQRGKDTRNVRVTLSNRPAQAPRP
jgi:S1-C subfamily serine protease